MLITPYFTFLHLPKTGGTYVIECIKEALRLPVLYEQQHASFQSIPAQYHNLPIVSIVRNPWTWYMSIYLFAKMGRHTPTTSIFKIASKDFSLTFEETLESILNPEPSLINKMEQHFKNQYSLLSTDAKINALESNFLNIIKENNIGLLTYLSQQIIPQNQPIHHLWRQESLRKSFFSFLNTLPINRIQLSGVLKMPDKNTSPKQHLQSLFSPELTALILKKDSEYITRFNYKIPIELTLY